MNVIINKTMALLPQV